MARGLLTHNLATRLELRGFEAPHQKETLNIFFVSESLRLPGRAKKRGSSFSSMSMAITHVGSVENEGYAVIRVACSW